MKKLYIIAALLLIAVGASAQEGKNIYNKWSDSQGVSAVYISPAMFRMIGRLPELNIEMEDGGKMDVAPLIRSFSGFNLLDVENVEIIGKLNADVESMIKKGKYELMMEMKDNGENVQIYTVGNDRVIESIVFFCRATDEVQFICLDGTMNRYDLETMIAASAQ